MAIVKLIIDNKKKKKNQVTMFGIPGLGAALGFCNTVILGGGTAVLIIGGGRCILGLGGP